MGIFGTLLTEAGLNIFGSILLDGTRVAKEKTTSFIEKNTGIKLDAKNKIEDFTSEELEKLKNAQQDFLKNIAHINLEETKAVLQDKTHARQLLQNLNNQTYASWLVRNTGSIIALITTLFTFSLWFAMLMDFTNNVNENILFAINSGLTLSLGYVLSFYFGSSKNESDLQKSKLHKDSQINLDSIITNEEIEIK